MNERTVLADEGWAGIAAALAAAQPGDVVRIAAGRYSGDETLSVPSGVSLIGEDGNELIYGGSEVAILIDHARDVSVSGLTLRGYDGLEGIGGKGETRDEALTGLIRIMASSAISITDNRIIAGALRRSCIGVVNSTAILIERNSIGGARRGIFHASSIGTIDDNDCRSNGDGILVASAQKNGRDEHSRTLIRNNRCQDNQYAGIGCAVTESVDIEYNHCRDNGMSGIIITCDRERSDVQSAVLIRANRCHDNGESGIVLCSSESYLIQGNDCWANGKSGIALQRDTSTLGKPSRALIRENRCHDNKFAGIILHSSNSEEIAGNDCWGNGMHGITLGRDPDSPAAPSDALIRDNRCHDNKQSGIILISSESEAIAGNDCWSNGTNGIALERSPESPNAPSHALIRDNRLADHRWAAIWFHGSSGVARGNRYRGNGVNRAEFEEVKGAVLPTPEKPVEFDPLVDPKLDLAGPYLAALRTPFEAATPPKPNARPPSLPGLAEFLATGCHGCFRAFWIGHRRGRDGAKPNEKPPTDPRHWHVSIAGEPQLTPMPANAKGTDAALLARIEHWRRNSDEDDRGAARWAVLVSPDEGDVDELAATLAAEAAKTATGFVTGGRLAPPLTVARADAALPLRDAIAAALLSRMSRRRAQVAALLRLKLLWAGLMLPLLAGGLIAAMGWHEPLWTWQQRWLGLEPVATWKLGQWLSLVGLVLAGLASFALMLRAQLPTPLRGRRDDARDSLWHRLETSGIAGLVDRLNPLALFPQRWRARWRDKADLDWQRRQMMRGNASVAPLIIADITGWHEGDTRWLARLAADMPKGKTLIGLLHIDGRLSLRPLIIDPPDAPWHSGFDLFLRDDESRLRISTAPAPPDSGDIAALLRPLAARDGNEAKELSTALGNDIWSALDLLPSLPLASAPTSRAVLQRVRGDASLNTDLMMEMLPAAAEFFGHMAAGAAIEQTTLDKLFTWAQSSRALRYSEHRAGSQFFERLTGRVAARRRVSEIMRSLWPQATDWREYVGAALRFGIWLRVTDLTRRLPSLAADPQAVMMALRDFEGLRFLGQDYQTLRKAGCVVHGDALYDAAWHDLRAVVAALPAAPQHDRLFARYLGAEHVCHRAAADLAEAQGAAIGRWLADPAALARGDGVTTAADAFCRTSARHIVALQNMEPQSRRLRLALHKELLWKDLPPALLDDIASRAAGAAAQHCSLAALMAAATTEAELEALVRLHALTPERTLYALSYAALRSIERRHGRAPDQAAAVAALIPVGRSLIDVRERLLSRKLVSEATALAEDFARGAAAAVRSGDAAAAFLSQDGAAATLLTWLTPSREEQLTNFEAQLAIDLRGVYEQSAARPAVTPAAPIQLRFDAAAATSFTLPGGLSKPS